MQDGDGAPIGERSEQARQWLLRYLAKAPDRDDAWYERVLAITEAPRRSEHRTTIR